MDTLTRLERATYAAERPVRRLVGSNRLNPLPHAGTISVFLLVVVVVTGVYITLFFQFGFEASYDSVRRMRDHPIQSVVRGIHRYSSAALVVTTVVHAWRTFVAGRFRGPRRWRWTTGVASLVLVWLAGVTGYWLVWDRRAQALNEAAVVVGGGLGPVRTFFVRDVFGAGADSGWVVLFLLWLAHLLLTVVIGWFVWRHVRRTRLAVLPPRAWMAAMGGALLLVAIVLPADLLGPVDTSRLVSDMPLDPFVLFLLPPLLDGWGWPVIGVVVTAITVAAAFPHLRRRPTPVVEIDADACTGCDLCVADCPYLALSLVERSEADAEAGVQARRPLAVVDADACVGCGICIGSCSFGAMRLPGFEPLDTIEPAGRHVVIACQRHLRDSGPSAVSAPTDAVDAPDTATAERDEAPLVVPVSCSGMVHANVVGALMQAGADGVQVVGCPAGDCSFGLGNTVLAERLDGTRAPHVARRWEGVAAEDWVAPVELSAAIEHPGEHPEVATDHLPGGRRLVAAVAVVLASILAVGLASQAPFRSEHDEAALRVLVDHVPGRRLEGQSATADYRGGDVELVVVGDGEELLRDALPISGGFAVDLVDLDLDPGIETLEVVLLEGDQRFDLLGGATDLEAGRRITVEVVDVPPPPGVAEGRKVFSARNLGACGVCHSTKPGDDGVGPSLAGVGTRAADRVPGMSAEEYLRESILDPAAHVVEGYRGDQMLPIYDERLSADQLDALVEYLLSLTADPTADEEDG